MRVLILFVLILPGPLMAQTAAPTTPAVCSPALPTLEADNLRGPRVDGAPSATGGEYVSNAIRFRVR